MITEQDERERRERTYRWLVANGVTEPASEIVDDYAWHIDEYGMLRYRLWVDGRIEERSVRAPSIGRGRTAC